MEWEITLGGKNNQIKQKIKHTITEINGTPQENKKVSCSAPADRLRKADTACTLRRGKGGRGECLLPDAVSGIRCRRAKEIPGSTVSRLRADKMMWGGT